MLADTHALDKMFVKKNEIVRRKYVQRGDPAHDWLRWPPNH